MKVMLKQSLVVLAQLCLLNGLNGYITLPLVVDMQHTPLGGGGGGCLFVFCAKTHLLFIISSK